MAKWLCKQEPDCYSLADLEKDGTTVWDGVANPMAKKNMRAMKPGDRVLFYHTGDEKAVVGEMEVIGEPQVPPDDEKGVTVEMKFVGRWDTPVTLAQIKADTAFEGWDLVRLPRLSVLAVTDAQWKRVSQLGQAKGTGKKK